MRPSLALSLILLSQGASYFVCAFEFSLVTTRRIFAQSSTEKLVFQRVQDMDGSGKQEAVNFNTVAAASAAVREKGAVRMMTSANSPISAENSAGAGSPSSNSNVRQDCQGKTSARHKLFGFAEARKMARMMGLSSKKEWDDYSCPGAYSLPKEPEKVWPEEWRGWEDWLGIVYDFDAAREACAAAGLLDEATYREYARNEDTRLPAQPQIIYKDEWQGWGHFLGRAVRA